MIDRPRTSSTQTLSDELKHKISNCANNGRAAEILIGCQSDGWWSSQSPGLHCDYSITDQHRGTSLNKSQYGRKRK